MGRAKQPCRICGLTESFTWYCAACYQKRIETVERLMRGEFVPGDELIINAGAITEGRVNSEGRIICRKCNEFLPIAAFGKKTNRGPAQIPLQSWCRPCDASRNHHRRVRQPTAAGASPLLVLPRNRPPTSDAARQMRTVLDDLSRALSRLEALGAGQQLKQIGDPIERELLGHQLERMARAAEELSGRLSGSGKKTGGGEQHDRVAAVRLVQ